jgi:hypothetical protein
MFRAESTFRPRFAAVALCTAPVLVALAAAGCGSSSSSDTSSTTSTTAITKTEFLARANAVCAAGNKVTDTAGAKLGNNPTQAQVTAVAKTVFVPSIQGQINRIRALGAPSGDEATVTHMLNLAQADLNKVKADPTLLFGKTDQFTNFAKIAHPYGLTRCAPDS